MAVPPSFADAYAREKMVAERLHAFAGTRLRRLSTQNEWLFADRIKNVESTLDKMQLGLVPSLDQMVDLYAATVIVPTRREVPTAINAIRADLRDARLRKVRRGDPQVFAYDDAHVFASLRYVAPGGINDVIRKRRFEIQVRTGLQYAWWRATHDTIYKGEVKDWRLDRSASQMRGTLEMVDGLLADLPAAAGLLEKRPTDQGKDVTRVISWLALWPETRRPEDRLRFSETVMELLGAARISLDGGEALLASAHGRTLVADPTLTPAQAMTILIVETRGLAPLWRRPKRRWILVTQEMESACPMLHRVPPADRAKF